MPNEVTIATAVSQLATVFSVDMTDDLLEAYYVALSDIDASLVKVAADELLKEAQFMPRPAELRRAAKRIQAESSDKPAELEHWRRDRYNCLLCRDTGFVTIWHPKTMQAAIRFRDGRITEEQFARVRYEAVARCSCRIGESKPQQIVQYDESKDIRITCVSQKSKFDLVTAWAAGYTPPNYVNDFDRFNDYSQEDF